MYQQQQQQQQQAMQYFNQVPGVYYQSYSTPMYYNSPILPVDEGTLQDYIRKQMSVTYAVFVSQHH